MGTSGYTDIFATKGMEYVFILFFIVVLVFFWRFLSRAEGPEISKEGDDCADGAHQEYGSQSVHVPQGSQDAECDGRAEKLADSTKRPIR